jgi:hypothetical protein
MSVTEQQQVMVRIDDSKPVYVGERAIEAIREDAKRELKDALDSAAEGFAAGDPTDIESMKEVEFAVARASQAVSALVCLAPIPDEDA